jgi:CRP/FNR family transcriptional regulator, cyclic AMP receptor protein
MNQISQHPPDNKTSPMQATTATLGRQPFFKGLTSAQLAVLAENSMQVEFPAGEHLFREGDPANRFYLIEEGIVVLESRKRDQPSVLIQTLGAGDELGWSWLFPPYYWHYDARALRASKAIFFYGTRLREQCDQDHDFGYELMKRTAEIVIQQLQATRSQLVAGPEPAAATRGEFRE